MDTFGWQKIDNPSRPYLNQPHGPSGPPVSNVIDQIQCMAMDSYAKEIDSISKTLNISPNPYNWTINNVRSWLMWQIKQYQLNMIRLDLFNFPGINLCSLTEEQFKHLAPYGWETLSSELFLWKTAATSVSASYPVKQEPGLNPESEMDSLLSNSWGQSNSACDSHLSSPPMNISFHTPGHMDYIKMEPCMSPSMSYSSSSSCGSPHSVSMAGYHHDRPYPVEGHHMNSDYGSEGTESDDEISEDGDCGVSSPGSFPSPAGLNGRSSGSHIHLWQFLKELLSRPQLYETSIRWVERTKGVFKIEDSVNVARLWGKRKNRPAMNYDKLSRSIRQYYKKGIMKKTERSQRLVYQFCHPYAL